MAKTTRKKAKPAEKKKYPFRGRPSIFPELNLDQVKKLMLSGWTDKQVCDFFGICEDTWYQWKKDHPDFSESVTNWKKYADENVERSLYQRACGFQAKATKFATFNGEISDQKDFIETYPPDTEAAKFWLKNRKPKEWRDKSEVDARIISLESLVAGDKD